MRDLTYYQGIPYDREWIPRDDESGRYFVVRLVQIPEIYGCGHTRQEALAKLWDAFDDVVSWFIEEGIDVPVPDHLPIEPVRTVRVNLVPMVPGERQAAVRQLTVEEARSEPARLATSHALGDTIDFASQPAA